MSEQFKYKEPPKDNTVIIAVGVFVFLVLLVIGYMALASPSYKLNDEVLLKDISDNEDVGIGYPPEEIVKAVNIKNKFSQEALMGGPYAERASAILNTTFVYVNWNNRNLFVPKENVAKPNYVDQQAVESPTVQPVVQPVVSPVVVSPPPVEPTVQWDQWPPKPATANVYYVERTYTPASGPPPTTGNKGGSYLTYMGCYGDKSGTWEERVFPEVHSSNLDLHECYNLAKSKNKKYFGLQNWNQTNQKGECWMGTNVQYDKYGAPTFICGHSNGDDPRLKAQLGLTDPLRYSVGFQNANAVYRINDPPV
jgi:hypothetical protein